MLVAAGDSHAALRFVEPYLAEHPDDPRALCLAGEALLGLQQSRRAVQLAERAAVASPDEDWPLRIQAQGYQNLGQPDLAQRAARQAVRTAPASWQSHYLSALSDSWMAGVTSATLDRAARARELAPKESEAHRLYGSIALEIGRPRLARPALEAALGLNPQNLLARQELARLDLRGNRFGQALSGLLSAGRTDPSTPATSDQLHRLVKQFEGAARYPVFLALTAAGYWPHSTALVLVLLLGAFGWRVQRAGGRILLQLVPGVLARDRRLAVWLLGSAAGLLAVLLNGVLGLRWEGSQAPAPDTMSYGWHPLIPMAFVTMFVFYFKKPLPLRVIFRGIGWSRFDRKRR